MSKIIGHVTSESSGIRYSVKLDSRERTVWVSSDDFSWTVVCQNVPSEREALQCAQKHIDFQKDLF